MTSILQAKHAAATELERLFKDAGWADGWGLTDSEIMRVGRPLFYKTATPKAAADAKIVVDGIGRNLYAVYSFAGPDAAYSGNNPHIFNVEIVVSLYYDDAHIFTKGSPFVKFLEEFYQGLSGKQWTISGGGEDSTIVISDRSAYAFSETIQISKIF